MGHWYPNYGKIQKYATLLHKSHTHLVIYQSETNTWCIHMKHEDSRSYMHFYKRFSENIPQINMNNYIPVEISQDRTYVYVRNRNISHVLEVTSDIVLNPQVRDFHSYLLQCSDWTKQFLLNTEILHEPDTDGNEYNIQLCSDGGDRRQNAGFGMILSINNTIISNTAIKLQPEYDRYTSYRCEAFGLLLALIIYDKLQKYFIDKTGNRKHGITKIFCDNEALIKIVKKMVRSELPTKFHYSADAALLREIIDILKSLGINNEHITIQHVKGHQDQGTSVLNYDAHLNVEADKLATRALNSNNVMEEPVLPHSIATLYINNKRATSNHTKHMREAHQLLNYKEHMKKSNNWTNEIWNSVWWEPHGKALKQLKEGEKTTIQKYLQKRLPSNKREHKYYGYIPAECKKCNEVETQVHILQCKGCLHRSNLREEYLKSMGSLLDNCRKDCIH
jgi:hypothetical protein